MNKNEKNPCFGVGGGPERKKSKHMNGLACKKPTTAIKNIEQDKKSTEKGDWFRGWT